MNHWWCTWIYINMELLNTRLFWMQLHLLSYNTVYLSDMYNPDKLCSIKFINFESKFKIVCLLNNTVHKELCKILEIPWSSIFATLTLQWPKMLTKALIFHQLFNCTLTASNTFKLKATNFQPHFKINSNTVDTCTMHI